MVTSPQSLNEFVNFRRLHLKGREKGEAQIFLDRFFQAFGHQGAIEAGATYEKAVKKGSRKGETGFADLVWKPRVLKAINNLSCYFIVPRHSKWFIFLPAEINWLPADSTTVIASDDFYVLGILISSIHRLWVKAQSSTLKSDTRYTHTTCFETFPFPQYYCQEDVNCRGSSRTAPTGIIQTIRNKTLELHEYRTQQMEKKQWGITQLYNEYFKEPASKLYKLHQQLDKLVMKAYNFKSDDDILSKLLELNLELAAKEKQGEKVIGVETPNLKYE